MKVFAALMAWLMLFVSVQKPVLTTEAVVAGEDDCCAAVCSEESSRPCEMPGDSCPLPGGSKGCCNTLCNPLSACCFYLPVQHTQLSVSSTLLKKVMAAVTDENGLSSFSADCWHPPRA
jgi:hypothetical protein